MNSLHTIPTHLNDTPAEHRAAIIQSIRSAKAQGRRPVLLCESYAQQLTWQRTLAREGCGFGVAVSTLPAWVEELWMLHGDGSAIVGPLARTFAMKQAAHSHEWSNPPTEGTLKLLERCAAEAMPYVTTEGCALSVEELHVAQTVLAYRALLRERNLIEASDACALLVQRGNLGNYQPIVVDVAEENLTHAQCQLLKATGAIAHFHTAAQPGNEDRTDELRNLLALLYRRQKDDAAITARGHVRMAFPMGPTAELPLIGSVIDQFAGKGTVIVACESPTRAFEALAPALVESGITCSFADRTTFGRTPMGRHLLNLAGLIDASETDLLLAADDALNIFAGVNIVSAFRSDQSRRNNRLIQPTEVLSSLANNAGESLQGVIGLLEEGRIDDAFDVLAAYAAPISACGVGPATSSLPALERAREACHEASSWGLSWQEAIRALEGASIPMSRSTSEDGEATVRFMSLDDCAQLPAASANTVLICNLCANVYPIKEPEDALSTLLRTWGCARPATPLATMRRTFALACAAARETLVLERALHDGQTEELQPASVFEELVDCYREDLASDAGTNKKLRIPQSLVPYATIRGEEALVANATNGALATLQEADAPVIGEIDASARPFITLGQNRGQETSDLLALSPSQIESYLECPYQWFAKRRLKLDTLEESFSKVERGNFIHSTLEHFYARFQQTIAPKVTEETLEDARNLMQVVFEETAQHQFEKSPGKGRYVPITESERRARDAILPMLQDYLEYETMLLPSFTPQYYEWRYGDAEPFTYAGCTICGSVDRIDVDEQGRAFVIDYKSSLSKAYRLHEKPAKDEPAPTTFVLPHKMQALMYAKVVRDLLGLQVVGTLYLNPLTCEIQGAYDSRIIGLEELPFKKDADATCAQVPWCDVHTFDELINRSEQLVAQRIEELAQGVIHAQPICKDACKYCPVGNCTERLEKRSI